MGAQVAHGRRAGGEQAVTSVLITLGMVSIVVAAAYLVSSGSLSPRALSGRHHPGHLHLQAGDRHHRHRGEPRRGLRGGRPGVRRAERARSVPDTEAAPPPGPMEPRIEFRAVSFRYATDLPPALDAASFSVAPGESVALVGHSGAGKSTCIHLLMRFWDVTDGAITIGGHDVRAFHRAPLREAHRLGAAGHLPVQHDHPREHPPGAPRCPGRGGGRGRTGRSGA